MQTTKSTTKRDYGQQSFLIRKGVNLTAKRQYYHSAGKQSIDAESS